MALNLAALVHLCASSTGIVEAHISVKVIRNLSRGLAKPGVRNAVDKTQKPSASAIHDPWSSRL